MLNQIFIISFLLMLMTTSSFAYLGPGIGGGIIAITLGILFALVAFLFGILWFPLKRLINKYKKNKEKKIDNTDN
jgi:hypothetical protein|tara:strand:+ start:239 stop:463 length:225 start_codon:yes stop_codon:yes gene_type:complete